ncbi:MAG: DEAD/DEAH box helicase family protein [Planctomycetes bacterium]|nr:DEAD/DEAH box helicase family protein [Planctomycetota bacterium]
MPLTELLQPGSALAGAFPGFELRPQQIRMLEAVEEAIASKKHLIVEAGTGVGKTFAYLLPIIRYAVEAKEPVLVSTHTINLQEQIVHKDLPFLQKNLPWKFTYTLGKGRGNYLCLRRLHQAVAAQQTLFAGRDEVHDLKRIWEWKRRTQDGSLSDLDWSPADSVWSQVNAERGNCMGRKSPFYRECFWQASRRRLRESQIIVVNHSLFFADAALRRTAEGIFPRGKVAVLDEAHTIEEAAQRHFGIEVTSYQVSYLLHQLYNPRKDRGLLSSFDHPRLRDRIAELHHLAPEFFDRVRLWALTQAPENRRMRTPSVAPDELTGRLAELRDELVRFSDELKDEQVATEMLGRAEGIGQLAEDIRSFCGQTRPESVYWVDISEGRTPRVTLKSAPLNVAGLMRDHVFSQIPTVILASATLTTGRDGSFRFMREKLGLADALEVRVGSPFDYPRQCRVYVESGMPDPRDTEVYAPEVARRTLPWLKKTEGSAFVLFTSLDLMRRVHLLLHRELTELGHPVLLQGGEMPRHEMLRVFKETANSVLFGVDSFWQGVDVPGRALRNVIIAKLPFPNPNQPLVEATIERIRDRGGSDFFEYSLPEAVLKLKQGFGRLIRTKTDEGIVVILDSRVVEKGYGRMFLDALPECPVEVVEP